MKFKTKIDLVYYVLLVAAFLAMVIVFIQWNYTKQIPIIQLVVVFIFTFFYLSIFSSTYYTFMEQGVLLVSGFSKKGIRYQDIVAVKKSMDKNGKTYGMSNQKVAIEYKNDMESGTIYASPLDRDGFIKEICTRAGIEATQPEDLAAIIAKHQEKKEEDSSDE